MVDRDRKQFAGLMASLSEVFDGGKEPSEFKMRVYWEALKDNSIEDLQRAVTVMLREREYASFPKPAEIRHAITGTQEERGALVWVRVVKAIERYGSGQSVRFPDPAIHSVIEAMGGWIELCLTERDQLKWKAKEFERLYGIMSEHGGEHPKHLAGRHEINNGGHGFGEHVPSPVVIEWDGERKQISGEL